MKKISFLTIAILLFAPLFSFAFTPVVGEVVSIDRPVNDDLYGAGGNILVQERVNGDGVLAGGDIDVVGPIAQDLMIAGGEIFVSSDVGDDARIVGGTVVIEENIQDDLLIFAGSVVIRDSVTIGGDLFIYAGDVRLEGDIKGNLEVNAGELSLGAIVGGDARIHAPDIDVSGDGLVGQLAINGNLSYSSSEIVPALEAATVGEVVFSSFKGESTDFPFLAKKLFVGFFFLKVIFLIVFASLIYFGFPALTRMRANHVSDTPGKSALTGALWFVLTPFAVVFLLGTIIGIPIGFALLAAYIFSFVFFELANVIVFTRLIMNRMEPTKKKQRHWIQHFGFIVLLSLVSAIVAGIDIIAGIFSLGSLLMAKWTMAKKA